MLNGLTGSEGGKGDNLFDGKRSRQGAAPMSSRGPHPAMRLCARLEAQGWTQEAPGMVATLALRFPDRSKSPCVLNMVEN